MRSCLQSCVEQFSRVVISLMKWNMGALSRQLLEKLRIKLYDCKAKSLRLTMCRYALSHIDIGIITPIPKLPSQIITPIPKLLSQIIIIPP